MLKNLDKKRLALIFIIPLIIIIFLFIIKGCSGGSSSFESYEKKMTSAAVDYFSKKNMLPVTEGGEVSVTLEELVSSGSIKSPSKSLNDKSCSGKVTVRNNGASIEKNNGGFYLYTPYLECDKYKTTYIIDKLKENIVTSKSGLYESIDGYIFKGDKVNNYVSFFDKLYRIISIDNNGIMRLVKVQRESDSVVWDTKYNIDVKDIYGVNDYSDSYIYDILNNVYLSSSDKQKKHLVANGICYGNRSVDYIKIDNSMECQSVLDNQFISLLYTYDYANASYDPNCVSIGAGACLNYNYLYNTLGSTWLLNGVTDNSYGIYYYSSGALYIKRASNSYKYHIVINLSGYELYTKGDGSKDNPYVIK